jgi:hypothetical protein
VTPLGDIQFYVIHQHHYADIPEDQAAFASSWVDYPNSRFDPVRGHELYKRHDRELALIDELGFDAIAVNEHHNTPFSMQPSPSLRAAHVIARTERIKIMVAGIPLNLSLPNRVAEEYAMLDVMSGGRMEFGLPLGTGMEYWSNAASISPTTARARFREGIQVLLQAWEEPGPSRFEGEHFHYRFLNPWPRPYQSPRPKLYIVGSGSAETLDLAVEFATGYSIVFVPISQQRNTPTTEAWRAGCTGSPCRRCSSGATPIGSSRSASCRSGARTWPTPRSSCSQASGTCCSTSLGRPSRRSPPSRRRSPPPAEVAAA